MLFYLRLKDTIVSFRRMILWRLLLLLIFGVSLRVHSQLDSNGFLSIDCGLPEGSSYVDNNLTYVSDEKFIDTGVNSNIRSDYAEGYSKEFLTVRYFPNGIRNCYTIKNLTIGSQYLIRGIFYYANYDGSSKPPIFDIYVGINYWYTLDASPRQYPEIIVFAIYDFLEVCLVNTKQGNIPFINSLHLRQLKNGMYSAATSNTSIYLKWRNNFGAITKLRYPDDKYDRWWYLFDEAWSEISTNASISYVDQQFEIPSRVLQTAAATTSTNQPFVIKWHTYNLTTKYYYVLQFYETQDTSKTGSRDFYVKTPGYFNNTPYPGPLNVGWLQFTVTNFTNYNISLEATPNSTLPPAINALELYIVLPVGVPTHADDVAAINRIKEHYRIKKGWISDPCFPSQAKWTGIDCNSSASDNTRITSLNLSSSLLKGPLLSDFGKLGALEYLYLTSNDLSGDLTALKSLTALKLLDITGNKNISTTLPQELLKRQDDHLLIYRYEDVSSTPSPGASKKKFIIPITVAVPLLVIAVAITIVLGLKRKKYNRSIAPKPNIPQSRNLNEEPQSKGVEQIHPDFGNRKFSYYDLKKITNNFKNNIGTGGYGSVYLGHLKNGVQVAVKMLSQSSSQGVKEFLAEAENLARVHHKNLVSLLGCCIHKSCMALVYEYMPGGNLHDKLSDNVRPLNWKQRLRIAYESAQVNNTFRNIYNEGLEYLHKACNPPLIHRDVKTSNILLSANLQAKIADFGLSRAFNNDAITHVSTRVVGTPGYLDPDYYLSNQLSAKSDVFSFGVVLLEIITGRPPITVALEGGNLVQWVRQKLSGGDIESIVDPNMQSKYDINSVWKVTDLACRCTDFTSSERPTMTGVAVDLKESLDLEMSMEEIHIRSTENLIFDVSQDSNCEMTYLGNMSAPGPRVR